MDNLIAYHTDFFRELSAPLEARPRRRSIYSFFLGRQDAVEDHTPTPSPAVHKKQMKAGEANPSETVFSVKQDTPTSPPERKPKEKRATSFIKRKPKLERGLSDQSVLRLNRNVHLGECRVTTSSHPADRR